MSSSKKVLGMVPARYDSRRFPGKMLAKIQGKTLIQRTYENALRCKDLDDLYIATDDSRIAEHIEEFGGKYVVTPNCPTGTDRLACALDLVPNSEQYDVVMNIQGDEPCIEPDVISKVIHALTGDAAMSTACTPVTNPEQLANPSCVKCVLDQNGAALYFSRSLIPHNAKEALHHLGIYCYKREFLKTYASMDATPLQLSEDLEQLKALENGYTIKVVVLDHPIIDVNDPEDIEKVERYLLENSICQ